MTLLTHFTPITKVARTHPGLLAVLRMRGDKSTMALVDLDELLKEGLDRLWWRSFRVRVSLWIGLV
jgi:hypothetical protein